MTVSVNGNELELAEKNNEVQSLKSNKGSFQALEEFTKLISQAPPKEGVQKTPDGKAETLVISYVEAKLDEIYLRQWGDENLQLLQIGNEIILSLTLWVIDPQTKMKITRTGSTSIQIMVDKAPEGLAQKDKNAWALDMANKKPNALKMGMPAHVSLARKNAAQTLGIIFGRNLNRKFEDTPDMFYTNEFELAQTLDDLQLAMEQAATQEELKEIWDQNPGMHANATFKKTMFYYKDKLNKS